MSKGNTIGRISLALLACAFFACAAGSGLVVHMLATSYNYSGHELVASSQALDDVREAIRTSQCGVDAFISGTGIRDVIQYPTGQVSFYYNFYSEQESVLWLKGIREAGGDIAVMLVLLGIAGVLGAAMLLGAIRGVRNET